MKVLVTGAAGFIGSNLVHWLLAHRPDWQITSYDALTYAGNLANLSNALENRRHTFVKGDVCDVAQVSHVLGGHRHDAILHLAAESHVDRSIGGPQEFVRTNIHGTTTLLDAARSHGVGRVVVVSTDEVYGSLGPTGKFTETMPLDPSSPYSASKAAADLLALAYHRTYGQDVVITRCSNNYGPFQFPEKLIPLMILRGLEDEPLPVYGDGRNVRDWIHVEDHCRGIVLALEKGRPGRTYNFGGNAEMENLSVVKGILRHLDKPESMIRFVTDRPGHDRRYAMDIRRAQEELGFCVQRSFDAGLKDTVEWYLANREWWTHVRDGSYLQYFERNYGERLAALEAAET